jgi:predicted nuclease of predicted toxin-antitoxin system
VRPLDLPLLADENIHPEVVAHLRGQGKDVQTAMELGLGGQSDEAILRLAFQSGRVVLTHDADFGTLAVLRGEPFTGLIYLRPGHIRPEFTIESLVTIAGQPLDVHPPFIIVADRSGQTVRVRVRHISLG